MDCIYLDEQKFDNNLLNQYFEVLSKRRKRFDNEAFKADCLINMEKARYDTLFLTAFILIKVKNYTYEEALKNVDISFLSKYHLYNLVQHYIYIDGLEKPIKITSVKFLLFVIYNNIDFNSSDILKCYEFLSSTKTKNRVKEEYDKIKLLIEKS